MHNAKLVTVMRELKAKPHISAEDLAPALAEARRAAPERKEAAGVVTQDEADTFCTFVTELSEQFEPEAQQLMLTAIAGRATPASMGRAIEAVQARPRNGHGAELDMLSDRLACVASGEFQNGLRHGPWRFAGLSQESAKLYVRGREVTPQEYLSDAAVQKELAPVIFNGLASDKEFQRFDPKRHQVIIDRVSFDEPYGQVQMRLRTKTCPAKVSEAIVGSFLLAKNCEHAGNERVEE